MRGSFLRGRLLLALALTSVLIGSNWLLFIWAANHHHMIETLWPPPFIGPTPRTSYLSANGWHLNTLLASAGVLTTGAATAVYRRH